ncbi:MAG: class I SAM-dependent rRNA methyltransferase [Elusimicrobiota bacterium]
MTADAERAAEKKAPAAAEPAPSAAGGFPRVVLKPQEDRRIRRGHLWVFSNEVQSAPPELGAGEAVHFYNARGQFLGVGFYNPHSLIAGRLLDRHPVAPDAAFFETRLRRALDMRERVYGGAAYRWVFGESDDLPGLIIDRYGDVCVLESYAAGMDRLLPAILEALAKIHPWKAVVLRNDAPARTLENLPRAVDVASGAVDSPHVFELDGLKIAADPLGGQKTGFFFDQRDNRAALAPFCPGRRVLDVFCHTGGFGLWAAKAGAARVTGVDDSEPALALARRNAAENGFAERMTFEKAEAFAYLGGLKENFDVVVLDPPRLAPSKKNLPAAREAYIRLNALGLRRVTGGGFLATASCSQHVDREEFRQILSRAAHTSGRRARLVHWGGQAKDHPVRLSMPETEYLKFAILHVS